MCHHVHETSSKICHQYQDTQDIDFLLVNVSFDFEHVICYP